MKTKVIKETKTAKVKRNFIEKTKDVVLSLKGKYRIVVVHGSDVYETESDSISDTLNSLPFTIKTKVSISIYKGIKSIVHVFNVIEAKKLQANKTYCDIIEKRLLIPIDVK